MVDRDEVLKPLLQVARYDDVDDLNLPMVQGSRANTTFFRLTATALATWGMDLSGRRPGPGDPAGREEILCAWAFTFAGTKGVWVLVELSPFRCLIAP
ncbi:hypothetical protein [Methanoculleus bourgensis]|uniref:hypothetical protein n=1 Tax=Methanoculleus bourgensis TaxID=83986 RepID=UPI00064EEEDD|nr:hypothetical protein [Methanoculleus bourgensis]